MKNERKINDERKRELNEILFRFRCSPEKEYKFKGELLAEERKYIHQRCLKGNIKSKSRGSKKKRILTLTKSVETVQTEIFDLSKDFWIHSKTIPMLMEYFDKYPDTPEVECPVISGPRSGQKHENKSSSFFKKFKNLDFNSKLPIFKHRKEIIEKITGHESSLTIVAGETGCGKSTQVPQYLLESVSEDKRILVTQPRRISCFGLSERVNNEILYYNGEKNLVAHCVRGSSTITKTTKIVFLTTGVLLRSLVMDEDGRGMLDSTDTLIIDEIHERDVNIDFLLVLIKKMLMEKDLRIKIVLMSATVSVEKFRKYFLDVVPKEKVSVVQIEGSLFPIYISYLEDVLKHSNFFVSMQGKNSSFSSYVDSVREELEEKENISSSVEVTQHHILESKGCSACGKSVQENANVSEYDLPKQVLLDFYDKTKQLRKVKNQAVDFDILVSLLESIYSGEATLPWYGSSILRTGSQAEELNQGVDTSLGTLVFLPGWAEIATLVDLLLDHPIFGSQNSFEILPLHSSIDAKTQRKIFEPLPEGIRRIVCSTNIAETSVTIDDIGFVVDTCLCKETKYDAVRRSTSLFTAFVNKQSATQRAGRSGRVTAGCCFRLVPTDTYDDEFEDHQTPEILRVSLEQICLQASVLIGYQNLSRSSLHTFLDRCLDPPRQESIDNAIDLLSGLQAVEEKNNLLQLTRLGRFLSFLPVHPSFGRMLLLGWVLDMFDTALNLAAFGSSDKEPFFLTPDMAIRRKQGETRMRCAMKSQIDSVVDLKLMHEFLLADDQYKYCNEALISIPFMKSLLNLRRQIKAEFLFHLRRFSCFGFEKKDMFVPGILHSGHLDLLLLSSCGENIAKSKPLTSYRSYFKSQFEENGAIVRNSCVSSKIISLGEDEKRIFKGDIIYYTSMSVKEIPADNYRQPYLKGCGRVNILLAFLMASSLKLDNIPVVSSSEESEASDSSGEALQNPLFRAFDQELDDIEILAAEFMRKYALSKRKERRKNGRPEKDAVPSSILTLNKFLKIECETSVGETIYRFRDRVNFLLRFFLASSKPKQKYLELALATIKTLKKIVCLHGAYKINLEKEVVDLYKQSDFDTFCRVEESESDPNLDMNKVRHVKQQRKKELKEKAKKKKWKKKKKNQRNNK
eukprot:maker-scaffold_54-snap-gene-0.39-mRNA-1 protein AED:0.24 eAED:0.24 QI:0/0/0/1/1/1/3/0/1137